MLGAAAADAWTGPLGTAGDTVKIMPGAALLLACPESGWEVAAGARELKLAAVGDDVTFDAAIVGVAAGS